MNKRAVIFGASGQDGFFLSKLLKKKGYIVQGVTRGDNRKQNPFVDVWSLWDYQSEVVLDSILNWKLIDEVYVLAGQSSVGRSFIEPSQTILSFVVPLTLILDGIRKNNPSIRLYNACSSEVFGDTTLSGALEDSPMNPVSPYGVAKKATSDLVKLYRNTFSIFCVNGYLFNHESHIRPNTFFSRKLVISAKEIKRGEKDSIELGCLNNIRDWGWAEDYVIPMNLMLNLPEPEDFIIASGEGHSLYDLAAGVFSYFDLNIADYYRLNPQFLRENDIKTSVGNPKKAAELLKWKSKYSFSDIVNKLVTEHEV